MFGRKKDPKPEGPYKSIEISFGVGRLDKMLNEMWADGYELVFVLQGHAAGTAISARYIFKKRDAA